MVETKKGHVVDEDYEEGTFEEDVYTGEGRELLEEGDEISEIEEGFVEGYESSAEDGVSYCCECKKLLVGENFIEVDVGGKICRFCSESCAEKYRREHKVE